MNDNEIINFNFLKTTLPPIKWSKVDDQKAHSSHFRILLKLSTLTSYLKTQKFLRARYFHRGEALKDLWVRRQTISLRGKILRIHSTRLMTKNIHLWGFTKRVQSEYHSNWQLVTVHYKNIRCRGDAPLRRPFAKRSKRAATNIIVRLPSYFALCLCTSERYFRNFSRPPYVAFQCRISGHYTMQRYWGTSCAPWKHSYMRSLRNAHAYQVFCFQRAIYFRHSFHNLH